MPTSQRARLAALITPLLPEQWRIVPFTVKSVGTLSEVTVFIDYTTLTPLEEAAPGNLVHGFEVAILSPHKDYLQAEESIDEGVLTFTRALDTSSQISWSRADKRGAGDYLGWIITLQLIAPQPLEV